MALRNIDKIPAGYSYRAQIARTTALAVGVLAVAIGVGRQAPTAAWLMLPAVWVFANFFEWTVHRFPMHRALAPRIMYRNHAQIHHTAFTDEAMAIAEPRELWLIMMPWYTIVMLLVAASPVAIVVGMVGGLPLAGIFYVGALSYFLFYEAVHAAYHLPAPALERLGLGEGTLFAKLRAHHAHHHQLTRMAHVNFNVTIPLADTVLGTRERPEPHEAAAGARTSPSRT